MKNEAHTHNMKKRFYLQLLQAAEATIFYKKEVSHDMT